MRLSQEAIRRMVKGRSVGGGEGDFSASDLAGYATQSWTDGNYISKTFFNELFVVHKKVTTVVMDGDTEVSRTVTTNTVFAPNEIPSVTETTDEETGIVTTVTTEIDSIEAKKGFWTNYFISALGKNSDDGGGGGVSLNEPLASINLSGLPDHPTTSGQTIVWNGSAWVYGTAGDGSGTVTGIKVGNTSYSPVNGIVSLPAYPSTMAWSAVTGKPTTLSGYGITDAKIENGVIMLGGSTITPLTQSDIVDMATKTWVSQQISDMATKTWVSQNYISIAYFNRLFQAYKSAAISDGNKVVPNDVQTTIDNLKIMVGAWTEQYLSALGKNSDGSGDTILNEPLASINAAGLASHPSSSGQTIVWNGSAWTYGTAGGGSITAGTGLTGGTSTGTISISSEYLTKISHGDTAYGWGNHATAGYAIANNIYSKTEADAKFLTIAAFERLFNALDSSGQKVSHPYSSGVTSIKALVGLWTEQYLSALGLSDSGGSGSGIDWDALAASTNEQINVSHLTTALAPYALTSQIPTSLKNPYKLTITLNGTATEYDGSVARSLTINTGLDQQALTTYLSSKILTIKNGATTLGTWNPTAAGTIDIASAVSGYLPLTGGTINGNLAIRGISHQNFSISSSAETSGVKWTGVQFQHVVNDTNVVYGGIRMDEQNGSFFRYNSSYTTYKMWDAGNDGAGSGLDADLLDGQHASYFATAANLTTAKGKITTLEGYFDNGVANSAKRLSVTSSYTAWGQTYWQNGVPNSISGNMTNVGSITMNGMLNINNSNGIAIWDTQHTHDMDFFWTTYQVAEEDTRDIFTMYAYESPRYWDISLGTHPNAVIGNNGIYYSGATARWGVKTLTPVCMFDIDGYAKANRLYLYKPNANNDTDAIYLEYNSANGGVHLVGGGLYTDTYVSALGLSNIGGEAFDESAMWQALGTTITEKQISSIYLTNALAPYALKTDIPTLKTLTIQNNGTQIGTYNGTTAVTVNIPLPKVLDNLYATRPTTANVSFTDGGLRQFKATSSMPAANGKPTRGNGDAHILHFGWDGNGWDAQFAILTSMQGVQYRTRNGSSSTWETWRTIIDNNNIAEFANSLYVSSLGTSGDYLTWTKNGVANNITIPYAQYTKILRSSIMATTDDYETLANYTVERGSFVTTNTYSYTSIPNINDYDTLVSFGYGNRTFQIKSRAYYETFSYRTVTNPSQGVYKFGNWKTIAFTDGNVASATRLEGTATKSAWGQTYWSNGQPQNISGNMTSVGNITMSGNLTMGGALTINNSTGITIWDTAHTHDMAMCWNTVSAINRDAFNIYSYEGTYYDVSLGVNANYVESLGGLYFSALQWAWGIGTNTPGRRFGSENVGLKLDVAGIARANQLQAYNTAGETLQLNTTATYNCILYRINDALKWSVGADSGNNFYWYTQPGGNKTVMYLTSAGVLNVGNSVKCTDLWIGNIHITYDSTNGGIHVANGGLSANTYVSALGVGQEGGGTQGLDIEAMWTELATQNSARQIDSSHISNALSGYVTTDTLNGYATQQWVSSQGFAYASSLSNYVSAVSTSSGKLNVTKGGSTTSTDIIALRLGQSTLNDSASLATFTHSTDLIYTAKGGSNTCSDKPTGVDSFGLIAMKTAGGYYGQMLMTSGGEVYTRASNSLSGGWRRQLDSSNWSSVVTLSALGGASTVALSEATTRISTLEGYFNTGGVAKKAAVLNTARTINGTDFDGSASITTRSWGTSRTITIADHDSSNMHTNNGIDGSEDITLYLPSVIKATLNGNASSATTATTASKLSTVSKTAWGQTYWTSGGVPTSISGDMSNVGNISFSASGKNIGGLLYFDTVNPQLKVDTSSTETFTHGSSTIIPKLFVMGEMGASGGLWAGFNELYYDTPYIDFHFNYSTSDYTSRIIETSVGTLRFASASFNPMYYFGCDAVNSVAGLHVGVADSSYIQIGSVRIVYDSANNALKVQSPNGGTANLYATGGVSALGIGQESGSGSDATFDTLTVESGLWVYDEIHCTSDIYGDNLYINNDAEVSTLYYEYLRQSSDMRLKDVVRMVDMDVETIGRAPLFEFRWKSRPNVLNIGTSAQYWRAVMPQVVGEDRNNYLSMDYAATALAGVISVARKVMTHEDRIAALEAENERLRNEIETLKAA